MFFHQEYKTRQWNLEISWHFLYAFLLQNRSKQPVRETIVQITTVFEFQLLFCSSPSWICWATICKLHSQACLQYSNSHACHRWAGLGRPLTSLCPDTGQQLDGHQVLWHSEVRWETGDTWCTKKFPETENRAENAMMIMDSFGKLGSLKSVTKVRVFWE